jgi:hypothetical protein
MPGYSIRRWYCEGVDIVFFALEIEQRLETLHAVRSAERSAQQTMAVEGMAAFNACSGVYFLYNYI